MIKISLQEARNWTLQAQGLHVTSRDAFSTVVNLGYVQIDTINIIERAHHHVLWSRNKNYRNADLAGLLAEKKVFEYWSHAAAYLPMEDFRYSLQRKNLYRDGKNHWFPKTREHSRLKKFILDKIKAEGAQGIGGFSDLQKKKTGGWYTWSPAKKAIEQLFMEGHLLVVRRDSFEKIYDLEERALPGGTDTKPPSQKEYCRHLIEQSVRAHGFLTLQEIAYQRKAELRAAVKKELQLMVNEGELQEILVAGETHYALDMPLADSFPSESVRILSPFDNLVIQRKRLKKLFRFDYQIECYVPEPKRKHGYFCLPILAGDKFIGRLDLKAHRQEKVLEVISAIPEDGVSKAALKARVKEELLHKMIFNGCEKIKWR